MSDLDKKERAAWVLNLCGEVQKRINNQLCGIMVCKTDFADAGHCDLVGYEQVFYHSRLQGSIQFGVYVIRQGIFLNMGDGGYINWCFEGHKFYDGKSVIF